jgi:tripartite motif-containing protein 71
VTAGTSGGEKDGAALSSWARYLKNKYGSRGKDGKEASSGTASRRLSLGLPLRTNSTDDSTDDQKNLPGSPTSPTPATAPAGQSFPALYGLLLKFVVIISLRSS